MGLRWPCLQERQWDLLHISLGLQSGVGGQHVLRHIENSFNISRTKVSLFSLCLFGCFLGAEGVGGGGGVLRVLC